MTLDSADFHLTELDSKIIKRVLERIAGGSRWADTARRARSAYRAQCLLDDAYTAFWNDERGAARNAHCADAARMYTMGRMSRIDILPAETIKSLEDL